MLFSRLMRERTFHEIVFDIAGFMCTMCKQMVSEDCNFTTKLMIVVVKESGTSSRRHNTQPEEYRYEI